MWIDRLNSEGGHLLIFLAMLVIFGVCAQRNIKHADEAFTGSFAGLMYAMRPGGSKPQPKTDGAADGAGFPQAGEKNV